MFGNDCPLAGVVVVGVAEAVVAVGVVAACEPELEFEFGFELVGFVALASTMTVPFMNGWIVQMYANVPAFANVCDPLCPLFRVPVSKLPSLAVAVCALGPSLVQVMVSPTWILIVAGANL